MEMIRHDDEFVQQIFSLPAIVQQGFQEKSCGWIMTKDRAPLRCDAGDEKCAVHWLSVKPRRGIANGFILFLGSDGFILGIDEIIFTGPKGHRRRP